MSNSHPIAGTGLSQCECILSALREHSGSWVAMPLLARASGGYAVHSRISDLRARGFNIEHHNERVGRVCRSFYKLVETDGKP